VCAALQPGGNVEQPQLTSEYDVVHKTGSTEEDRAAAIDNMYKKLKIVGVVAKI